MRDANTVLNLLRHNPAQACAAYGFVTRGAIMLNVGVGGPCTITPVANDAVYELHVTAGGPDYFIPFQGGAALYCDVPRNLPDGTMVVTYAMNGCALEVHGRITANRFYHDANGRNMPAVDPNFNTPKYRADYNLYAGPQRRAEVIGARITSKYIPVNFEHAVMCIKKGGNWEVYQTAVVKRRSPTNLAHTWHMQVKDYIDVSLGSFPDF